MFWLNTGRDALFDILREHLAKVGGLWSSIDWQEVAERFNQRLQGVTQRAGVMVAERRYDTKNKSSLLQRANL
jgi:hypothetical protein